MKFFKLQISITAYKNRNTKILKLLAAALRYKVLPKSFGNLIVKGRKFKPSPNYHRLFQSTFLGCKEIVSNASSTVTIRFANP